VTAVAALIVALVALAGVGFALLRLRFWRISHERLAWSLLDTTARLEGIAHQLEHALDRLRREARVTAALGDVALSSDLDEVLSRVAAAAAATTGARAAVARAVADDGRLVVGATEDVANLPGAALEWPPESARAMTFTLLGDATAEIESAGGCGLVVPIAEPSGRPVGLVVALFDEDAALAETKLGDLERLAARAAPIVTMARAAPQADDVAKDPLTGLSTRRAFHENLAREVARAHRNGTPLALLVLDLEDFRSVNERIGRSAADEALRVLAAALEAITPPGGLTSRIGGDDFALILPGCTRVAVERVLTHLRAELRDRVRAGEGALSFSTGAAELTRTDDALRLLARATRALQRARVPDGLGDVPLDAGESS
jgi:diguanylate cyclase (GGDEF)-like protein